MKGTYQGRVSEYKLLHSKKKKITGRHWTDRFAVSELNSSSDENFAGDTRT